MGKPTHLTLVRDWKCEDCDWFGQHFNDNGCCPCGKSSRSISKRFEPAALKLVHSAPVKLVHSKPAPEWVCPADETGCERWGDCDNGEGMSMCGHSYEDGLVCTAMTVKGRRCRNVSWGDESGLCHTHRPKNEKARKA